MRALPVCLIALMLSGCSMLSRSPVEPVQSTATPPVKSEPTKPRATRPAPVRIYTDASELVGKPFRDLGEVTGESCQASNQDSPPPCFTRPGWRGTANFSLYGERITPICANWNALIVPKR